MYSRRTFGAFRKTYKAEYHPSPQEKSQSEMQDESQSNIMEDQGQQEGEGSYDVNEENIYEVEAILDKRIHGKQTQYLIKWVDWDLPKYNTWEPLENLTKVKRMVEKFEEEYKLRKSQASKPIRKSDKSDSDSNRNVRKEDDRKQPKAKKSRNEEKMKDKKRESQKEKEKDKQKERVSNLKPNIIQMSDNSDSLSNQSDEDYFKTKMSTNPPSEGIQSNNLVKKTEPNKKQIEFMKFQLQKSIKSDGNIQESLEKQKEKQKERERERERQKERQMQRQRQKEKEKERQRDRQKEQERERQREMQRQRYRQKQRQWMEKKERQKQKEKQRQKQHELQKQRQTQKPKTPTPCSTSTSTSVPTPHKPTLSTGSICKHKTHNKSIFYQVDITNSKGQVIGVKLVLNEDLKRSQPEKLRRYLEGHLIDVDRYEEMVLRAEGEMREGKGL